MLARCHMKPRLLLRCKAMTWDGLKSVGYQ
jgi:hypothetical protein